MNNVLNWTATLGLTTALLVSSVPMANAVVAEETLGSVGADWKNFRFSVSRDDGFEPSLPEL